MAHLDLALELNQLEEVDRIMRTWPPSHWARCPLMWLYDGQENREYGIPDPEVYQPQCIFTAINRLDAHVLKVLLGGVSYYGCTFPTPVQNFSRKVFVELLTRLGKCNGEGQISRWCEVATVALCALPSGCRSANRLEVERQVNKHGSITYPI